MSPVPTSLESLIAEVLAVDEAGLTDESGRGTVTEWDSVAHLNILSAVEETFDVMFSSAEMRELTSVGSIRIALKSKETDG
jgi:acyl carrier protein